MIVEPPTELRRRVGDRIDADARPPFVCPEQGHELSETEVERVPIDGHLETGRPAPPRLRPRRIDHQEPVTELHDLPTGEDRGLGFVANEPATLVRIEVVDRPGGRVSSQRQFGRGD